MDSLPNLRPILDELNRDYFCNAIVIDEIRWECATKSGNSKRAGYYLGDRLRGDICVVNCVTNKSIHGMWDTVCHEMLHQLQSGHEDPFYPIMKAIDAYWKNGTVDRRSLSDFCNLLLDNISLKINKGVLHHSALSRFDSFPLYRLLMGDTVKLCGPSIKQPAVPQPTVILPRVKIPVRANVRTGGISVSDIQDALWYAGGAAGFLFLALMIVYA